MTKKSKNPSPQHSITSVRILPTVYARVLTAVATLKQSHRDWGIGRIVNIALIRFLDDLQRMSPEQVEHTYQKYLAAIKGE